MSGILEIFDVKSDALVGRWDIEIMYGYVGDGTLWVSSLSVICRCLSTAPKSGAFF
jgi:hypothetical protein